MPEAVRQTSNRSAVCAVPVKMSFFVLFKQQRVSAIVLFMLFYPTERAKECVRFLIVQWFDEDVSPPHLRRNLSI